MMLESIRAVLFDLDGTLLDADMNVFLPRYFELLASSVAHLIPPDRFVPCLMQASDAMVTNDGRDTNVEVFAEAFYPCVGRERADLEPVFLDFYANQFPKLQRYTRRKPEARLVVEAALKRDYAVVIATNPLFPAAAIQQRLEWAGVADMPFDRVTTYENSRATKPSLLYYEEICAAIQRPARACLMVGDEDVDMVAARLGCTTFLVPGPRTRLEPSTPEPAYRGTLADLLTLLRNNP